mgnify:CR=1 FL=1
MNNPFEMIKVVDNKDQCDWLYGGDAYFIDDNDIELLKSGKIINFSVNQEYGCALIYSPSKLNQDTENDKWLFKTGESAVCPECKRNNALYGTYCKFCGSKNIT